jgi:homogentisate phytyltransferase / homogentisate geranylgeranyltransferase
MKQLKIFWQFCRPHTIFGSLFSVTTLYLLVANEFNFHNIQLLLLTLIASLACNVFIVGLNQIIDVELDKINKPTLPIAAGTLTLIQAKKIIAISFVVSIVVAFFASNVLGALIVVISLIGYIYSAPPIQLKKHHLPAAISITLVRGILVNIGMYLHFKKVLTKQVFDVNDNLPSYLYTLTIFVAAFSIAIAWFKDLPDTEGDAKFNFKTLAVLYKPKTALLFGSIIVAIAYIYCIYWAFIHSISLLMVPHIMLFLLFILNLFTINLKQPHTIKNFYMRFWIFFFAEYILFAVWALAS